MEEREIDGYLHIPHGKNGQSGKGEPSRIRPRERSVSVSVSVVVVVVEVEYTIQTESAHCWRSSPPPLQIYIYAATARPTRTHGADKTRRTDGKGRRRAPIRPALSARLRALAFPATLDAESNSDAPSKEEKTFLFYFSEVSKVLQCSAYNQLDRHQTDKVYCCACAVIWCRRETRTQNQIFFF